MAAIASDSRAAPWLRKGGSTTSGSAGAGNGPRAGLLGCAHVDRALAVDELVGVVDHAEGEPVQAGRELRDREAGLDRAHTVAQLLKRAALDGGKVGGAHPLRRVDRARESGILALAATRAAVVVVPATGARARGQRSGRRPPGALGFASSWWHMRARSPQHGRTVLGGWRLTPALALQVVLRRRQKKKQSATMTMIASSDSIMPPPLCWSASGLSPCSLARSP